MFDPPSQRVETAGYRTHYVQAGAGPSLILLHGGSPGADGLGEWRRCMLGFASRFRTLAYDLVGFGRTDTPDLATFPYDRDARTDQAIAFIEALDLAPASLVGASMGGAVALGVALRRPDLVHKMVLVSSAGLSRPPPPPRAAGALTNYKPSLDNMRAVVRAMTRPGFEIDDDLVRYRLDLLAGEPGRLAAFVRTMTALVEAGGQPYEDDEIASIKTQALIFHGRDDRTIPVRQGMRMLELLSEAHGHIVPHCGHWAMWEQPDTLVRVSLDFLLAA